MAQGNNYPRGNSYNNGYNRNDDFRFNIKESIAVISEGKRESGWKKEVNLVEWNGNPGKIDIREWDPDHTKMGRGVTLTEEEAEFLALVLSRRYGLKNGKDAQRDAFLQGQGLTVLRYSNLDVNKNFEGVCDYLDEIIKNRLI